MEWSTIDAFMRAYYQEQGLIRRRITTSSQLTAANQPWTVNNMGEHALKSHAKGVTHKKNVAYYQERDSMKHTAVIPDIFISSNSLVEILFMT